MGWDGTLSCVHVCVFSMFNCEEHNEVSKMFSDDVQLDHIKTDRCPEALRSSHCSDYESAVSCNVQWFIMFNI